MHKLWKLLVGVLLVGFMATPAQAKVISVERGTAFVGEDEVIEDDLYISGETVEILGTVDGDVYAAGGIVEFSGETTGDLLIGSGEARVSGEVGDDLWIGAGNVYLSDLQVGDGVNIGAGSVIIDADSTIGGSLLAGAGMLDVRAPIGRNMMVGAGLVKLNAPVGGEMRVGGDTIELGSKVNIAGDLTYMADSQLVMADEATVAGMTQQLESRIPAHPNEQELNQELSRIKGEAKKGLAVFSFLGSLLVGSVLLWLLKKPTLKIAEIVEKQFFSTLGWGLLVLVLAIPALILMMVTVVGIPLALILMVVWLVSLYLAKIWASMALGGVITKQFGWKKVKPLGIFALGLLAYYVLLMIPVVSVFVKLTALLSGLGALFVYLRSGKK